LLFASSVNLTVYLRQADFASTVDQIVDLILTYPRTRGYHHGARSPRSEGRIQELFETYLKKGIAGENRCRMHDLEEDIRLTKTRNHTIEVIVDRVLIKPDIRRRLELSVKPPWSWPKDW